jgi:hypothetical protein
MELDYEYGFSIRLVDDLPASVVDALTRLAEQKALDNFPATGANVAEVADADIFRLLTDEKAGGLAQGFRFDRDGVDGEWHLRCWGAAPAEAFFMPFPALSEWLAQWALSAGWVGFYHRSSLDHPTMIYFAASKVYMLQVTGSPVGMIDGDPFPELDGPPAEEDWDE